VLKTNKILKRWIKYTVCSETTSFISKMNLKYQKLLLIIYIYIYDVEINFRKIITIQPVVTPFIIILLYLNNMYFMYYLF